MKIAIFNLHSIYVMVFKQMLNPQMKLGSVILYVVRIIYYAWNGASYAGFALPIAIFANYDIFLNLAIENKNWRKKW